EVRTVATPAASSAHPRVVRERSASGTIDAGHGDGLHDPGQDRGGAVTVHGRLDVREQSVGQDGRGDAVHVVGQDEVPALHRGDRLGRPDEVERGPGRGTEVDLPAV